MPIILGLGALALGAFGYAANQTGEATEKTGNTLIKVAIVGGVGYYLLKKTKVL